MRVFLKKESPRERALQVLRALIPIAVYGGIYLLTMVVSMFLIYLFRLSPGAAPAELTTRYGLWIMGAAAVAALFLFPRFMNRNPQYLPSIEDYEAVAGRSVGRTPGRAAERTAGRADRKAGERARLVCFYILLGAAAAFGLNVLANLIYLFRVSGSYEATAEVLFGGGFLLQVMVTGILVPIAEELVFRGAVLNQLQKWMTPMAAALCSGLLFGVYHGNLIQFCYGTIMGILFAKMVQESKDLSVAILLHISANCCILLCTQFGVMEWVTEATTRGVTGIFLAAAVSLGCIYGLHKIQ